MGKLELQRDISKGEGYILSNGTHDLEHLLSKVYDLLVKYKIRSAKHVANEVAEVINYHGGLTTESSASYYGKLQIKDTERASYLWNEDVFQLFNQLSPKGYYFGSHEGDGACIGWFKSREE